MKFLEENTGVNLHYLGWETVSQMTPKAWEVKFKKKINWTSSNKKLVLQDTIKKMKRQLTENVCKILLIKDLYLDYIKNSYNSMIKRQTTQLKMVKWYEQTFPRDDIQTAISTWKDAQYYSSLKEMQINTIWPLFTHKKIIQTIISIAKNVKKLELSYIAGENIKWHSCSGKVWKFP